MNRSTLLKGWIEVRHDFCYLERIASYNLGSFLDDEVSGNFLTGKAQ